MNRYDVALSFASEDQDLAEKLANLLRKESIRVYYYPFEDSTMWGKNLYEYLHKLYSQDAKYCIVFVSKNYVSKKWTRHEWQSAQERALQEKTEYILPLKVDDSVLPGLSATIAYIDLREKEIEDVVRALVRKIREVDSQMSDSAYKSKESLKKTRNRIFGPILGNAIAEFQKYFSTLKNKLILGTVGGIILIVILFVVTSFVEPSASLQKPPKATSLPIDLNKGLIAHYPLDGDANDASGNNYSGEEIGKIDYVRGKIGEAARFFGPNSDGDGAYIKLGNHKSFNIGNNEFTVSLWVLADFDQYAKIINKGQTGHASPAQKGYSIKLSSVRMSSKKPGLGWGFNNDLGKWDYAEYPLRKLPSTHFIMITGVLRRIGKKASVELFINDEMVSSYEDDFIGNQDTDSPLIIGAMEKSFAFPKGTKTLIQHFSGVIDEVRIYKRALFYAEIKQLYNLSK